MTGLPGEGNGGESISLDWIDCRFEIRDCRLVGWFVEVSTRFDPQGVGGFPREPLKNSKRRDRKSKLVCLDCVAEQQAAEKKLRDALKHKDAWKCTCRGPHVLSNEECKLYPAHAGERRPGKNYGVTEEEWQFLERMREFKNA